MSARIPRIILITLGICILFPNLAQTQPTTQPRVVRVAITGGIDDNGFWQALSAQFEKKTGVHVESASGQKDGLADKFKQGGIDLVAMYSSDSVMSLVADGYATDPTPWIMSDLVIVGPPNDPAGIHGMTDAAAAIKKIVESKSPFVIHGSLGADVVVRDIVQELGLELDPAHTTILLNDHQRQVLQAAVDKKAYTLIARVPFRSKKLPNDGMAVMVEGDPRLRRPYVLALANPLKIPDAHLRDAQRLVEFLGSSETQTWIASYNKGKFGDKPEFFPIAVKSPATRSAGSLAEVRGEIPKPFEITAALMKSLPRTEAHVKNEAGQEFAYSGVLLSEILKKGGARLGNHQFRAPDARFSVVAAAPDGFSAVFSLTEFDEDFGPNSILLADEKDGKPLEASEGPLRVIVPHDQRQARWVRQVASIEVK